MLKRILKTLLALSFGQIITKLGSFILIPLYVTYWSPTIYGEWLTLFAAVGYLATLDFGISQAAINKLTQAYSVGDLVLYPSIQKTGLIFYSIIAIVTSILMLCAIFFFKYRIFSESK